MKLDIKLTQYEYNQSEFVIMLCQIQEFTHDAKYIFSILLFSFYYDNLPLITGENIQPKSPWKKQNSDACLF